MTGATENAGWRRPVYGRRPDPRYRESKNRQRILWSESMAETERKQRVLLILAAIIGFAAGVLSAFTGLTV
ncbi:MAG: hypothetical protein HYZ57_01470 [Acidobacteria bacterium]|nr:hypothetical protein [Acidobacteriota bacterium]